MDNHGDSGEPTRPDDSQPGEPEHDPVAGIDGIKRVTSIHTVMKPIHREPPPPPKPDPKKTPGSSVVELRIRSFLPEPKKSGMATMSDLGKSGTRGGFPQGVARSPKPAEPEDEKP